MLKNESNSRPARGRPALSEDEIADMRKRIAECALRLFQKDGYDAVSMRRLAKEAGCTVMTLYRYFDRKIDLLRALWEDVFTDLFDQLDLISAKIDEPTKRLNAVALGYVEFWLERREHYFLVFMSSGVSQPDVSVFVDKDGVVERFSLFYTSLADALGPKTNASQINLKSQLLLCTLNGIAHNLITISAYPWASPKSLVQAAVNAVLKS